MKLRVVTVPPNKPAGQNIFLVISNVSIHPEGRMGEGYAPEWKVNAGVDYQFNSKLRGTLFMNYVDNVFGLIDN